MSGTGLGLIDHSNIEGKVGVGGGGAIQIVITFSNLPTDIFLAIHMNVLMETLSVLI